MKYNTRDFGEMEIAEDKIIDFIQPPFGFEKLTKYTFLYDCEIGDKIVWMQSVEDADTCFILFDPSSLASFYAPQVPQAMQDKLGEGELLCWVIGVVPQDASKATVNLKSPIIVNMQTNRAAQVILDQDYPIRYPIGKGGAC